MIEISPGSDAQAVYYSSVLKGIEKEVDTFLRRDTREFNEEKRQSIRYQLDTLEEWANKHQQKTLLAMVQKVRGKLLGGTVRNRLSALLTETSATDMRN